MAAKRINVTVTPYDGGDFPEASQYGDYVARSLVAVYPGFEISVSTGRHNRVFVYGAGAAESAMADEIEEMIKAELWERFCADGWRNYQL